MDTTQNGSTDSHVDQSVAKSDTILSRQEALQLCQKLLSGVWHKVDGKNFTMEQLR